MKITLHKNKKQIGSFVFSGNKPVIDSEKSEEMQEILSEVEEEKIPARQELKLGDKFHLLEKNVSIGDDYFPYAFISWLRRKGYKVEVGDVSVDDKISQKMEEISDPDLKDKISNKLSSMTYLEKTFLLEIIKQ